VFIKLVTAYYTHVLITSNDNNESIIRKEFSSIIVHIINDSRHQLYDQSRLTFCNSGDNTRRGAPTNE